MARTKPNKLEKLLTEVELELMNIIWELKECNVKEVQKALPAARQLAYTSIATIMKILKQKGYLTTRKGERAFAYTPLISRAEYEAASLTQLAQNLFRGDPKSMVMRMLDHSDLSESELESIRNSLESRLQS